jgi:D-alanyl-D-alanine carboxypeptidase/D-alanyl-D-alanine-endopeptidase (penicillin-binding protein 4)
MPGLIKLIPLLMLAAITLCAALQPGRAIGEGLAERLSAVIDAPQFKHAHWGVLVADVETGETLYEQNADKLFVPASTTKLFSVSSALDALGADHRFLTPIFARGEVNDQGELSGDLILRASGDLTMGGRTDAAGRIGFANVDHTYADFSATAELIDADPLAGLNELAMQVAAAGIRRVRGDVLIDDRLFERAEGSGSGPSLVTPMLINDNLIDILVTPTEPAAAATIAWRPQSTAWQIDAVVHTVAADGPTKVEATVPAAGRIVVRGTIAAGRKPLLRIVPIDDPASFARSLLIEALARQGVAVEASSLAANAADRLPGASEYDGLRKVAELTSPSFAENARLILKVSHNLHASTLPLLVAARHGERTLAQGLRRQHDFLARAGVDVETISFGGAAGGDRADYVTPRAAVQLLRHMATRPDFDRWLEALPVMGVDGTLVTAVAADSPAKERVQAKTGTLIWSNTMNGRFLMTSKALAGYATTQSGRRLAFGLYVNNVHLDTTAETGRIGQELGRICEILCEAE